MRIGYDAKRIFHNFTGLGNYGRTLVESVHKFYPGTDIYLYTPAPKDYRGKDWYAQFPELNIKTPEGKFNNTFSSVWRSLLLTKELKKDGLDIYHGLSHELPPGIEETSIKSIVTIHDLIFMRYPQFFPLIDRKVYHRKFAHSCRVADRIVAISEQTKTDIIDFLNVPAEKIEVVYQTCNPIYYQNVDPVRLESVRKKYNTSEPYLLYVGSLEERKNLLNLIKAIALLNNKEIPLYIVGKGKDYKKKMVELAKNLEVSQRLVFLEDVPQMDLPGLYQDCAAFIYPAIFEGFGIPIIEALFSNAPVVTSTGSCFSEAGGEGSIYVSPENPEKMAESIDEVISNSDLRAKMQRVGQNYVEKFHWKNTSAKMMDLYQALL